jgi:thiol-disulfide isomerase/thioredoxin
MKVFNRFAALAALTTLLCTAQVAADTNLLAVPGAPAAENFNLPDRSGEHRQLTDYRGNYVLVNFWAEWCSPCVRELPSMQRVYSALHGKKFEILAVHVGPAGDKAEDLLKRFGVEFPVLLDTELALTNWKVQALPSSYLLDPEGRVIYWAQGAIDWDDSESRTLLNGLLDDPAREAAAEDGTSGG